MLPIEERFTVASAQYGLGDEGLERIFALLLPLKCHHQPTYEHSLRVGVLSGAIGATLRELDGNPRPLVYSGALHDAGKQNTPVEVLDITGRFTLEDRALMRQHVLDGYEIVRPHFAFSAEIVLRHHLHQPNPYPDEPLPTPLVAFSEETLARARYGSRLVALADYCDALESRRNQKFGTTPLSPEMKAEKLLCDNPDIEREIRKLLNAGVIRFS